MKSFLRRLCATLLLLPGSAFAATPANSPPTYNQIHFQVERNRVIENDRMYATVSATVEDESAARVADQINRTMEWSLKLAKSRARVEARSGAYRTEPVYEKGRIRRWRATQEMMLESADFAVLSALLGVLQERVQISAMHFTVSAERRRAVEDELIAQALAAFQQRAELVRKHLGAKTYKIVDVSIHTSGGPPMPLRGVALERSAVADPAVEAGTSTLTLGVSGTIELQ